MGVNLYLVEYNALSLSMEKLKWWDSLRCAGDAEFIIHHVYNSVKEADTITPVIGETYWRPRYLDLADVWIEENIQWPNNKKRLQEAIQLMRERKDVWFYHIY